MLEYLKKWLLDREYKSLLAALKKAQEEYNHALGVIESLKGQAKQLKEDLEDLKLKKRISEEEIAHMVKMREERQRLDLEAKELAMEREKAEAIQKVKDEYTAKYEGHLVKQAEKSEALMESILNRLPNISAELRVRRDGK